MEQIYTFGEWDGLEWDEGNLLKNWEKHRVTASECEQIFFNRPLVTGLDSAHSYLESRHYALGETDDGRGLFVVFTVRESKIRVISARDMSRREREVFDGS